MNLWFRIQAVANMSIPGHASAASHAVSQSVDKELKYFVNWGTLDLVNDRLIETVADQTDDCERWPVEQALRDVLGVTHLVADQL